MKCDRCEKQASFHITERVGDEPQWEELHLCENCARDYLSKPSEAEAQPTLASALAQHLKLGQTAEELAKLDQQTCPICGISFYEFRHQGRLGCPHDYVCFEKQLMPLIDNIHGETHHSGKRPQRAGHDIDKQTRLIRLRRDMREAIKAEDYERASQLRDEIRSVDAGSSGKDSEPQVS
jgi:protein arginine kinase activator